MPRPTSKTSAMRIATSLLVVVAIPGAASSQTWVTDGGGAWGDAANWSPAVIPDGPAASVGFSALSSPSASIGLVDDRTLAFLGFTGSTVFSIDATRGGGLTFAPLVGPARISVDDAARQVLNTPLTLAEDIVVDAAARARLSLTKPITGPGALEKRGPGTLTLTGRTILDGAKSYTGGTVISGGTLQLGFNGSIVGDVVNDGQLVFNQLSRNVFAGDISGTGEVRKINSGTLVLTGDATHAGGTTVAGGELRIGDGGASGSIAGDVVNDASLVFDRSDVFTFAGGISGSGGVEQAGAGVTVLNGTNTYTGGTLVSGGTLQLGFTGSILGDVVNDGRLVFNQGSRSVFAGDITGAGEVRKINPTTLVLTGDATHAGGTTVAGGELRIGDGGSSGSLAGDVANDASLVFDRSDDVAFGGAISGRGRVEQAGSGVTVLNGANTYTGGTLVSGGTLQLGFTGSILGDVVNDGRLVFNQGSRSVFAGDISGTGEVRKINPTTLVLTGDATHAGGTTVAGGELRIGDGGSSGSLAGDVANDASLVFDRSDDVAFGGAISGSGALVKEGAGELVLTGDIDHSGETRIAEGALTFGAGSQAASNAFSGDIVNDGVLRVERTGRPLTLGGPISGTGRLDIVSSMTTLTGANTYSGGSVVRNGGNLVIGAGGVAGSVTGDILLDGGGVAFRRSDDVSFDGAIAGDGHLGHAGTGVLALTGVSTFNGRTDVNFGGTLRVDGAIASDVRLFATRFSPSPARLEGVGVVGGAVTVEDGSTVAPGTNGVGVLRVGALDLTAGSVIEIDAIEGVGGSLSADRLNVDRAATFGRAGTTGAFGPTLLDVRFAANADLPAFQGLTVLSADGGLAGVAPTVALDPTSLPNGRNFHLGLEATNLGGTFAGPGEAIPVGAGGEGVVVLQIESLEPDYVAPPQITVINAPHLVPSQQPVLAPNRVPQLSPQAVPTAIPVLAPVLVKGPDSQVTTPIVATPDEGIATPTGVRTQKGGVQLGGGTITPQPQTVVGVPTTPTALPIGTVSNVVVVDPPDEVVIVDTVSIPIDNDNTDVVVIDPPDATTTEFVSISGSYGSVDQTNAPDNGQYALIYRPHSVSVALVPASYGDLRPNGVAQTATQSGVGAALDTLLPQAHARPATPGQATLVTGLYPQSLSQITGTLDSIAGTDTDPTFVSVLNDRILQDAVGRRLGGQRADDLAPATEAERPGAGGRATTWGDLVGRYAEADDYLGGADLATFGVILGADATLAPGVVGGVGVAYADTRIDLDSGGDDRVRTLDVAAYGSWTQDGWFANGSVGVGYHWLGIDRRVALGATKERLSADADARSVFAGVEVGRAFATSFGVVEPTASLRYAYVDRDGFTESGSPALAREVSDTQLHVAQALVGVRAYGELSRSDGSIWRPEMAVGYGRELGDTDIHDTASLVSAPGMGFPVVTAGPGEDAGFLRLGLSASSGPVDYHLGYSLDVREDLIGQALTVGLRIAF